MPTKTTIENADRLKEIILNHLQGQFINVTKVSLEAACADTQMNCKDLYKSITIDYTHPDEDKFLVAILGTMNIKKGQPSGSYERLARSKNLHELLTKLYHDGHHQVGYLLTLIENTKVRPNWAPFLFMSTLFTGLLGSFFYLKNEYIDTLLKWIEQTFPTVMAWMGRTFSMLRNIPLLGIIYNSLGLAWHWYGTFSNGTTSNTYKLESLLFKTLTAGLTIAAYILTYLAEGILALPAAVLFVAAASIDTFKSLFFFYRSQNALRNLSPPTDDNASWEQVAEYERAKNLHYRSMQTVGIKLAAALATTITVGIWNFFPPSLILTIACMSVISLVSLTKKTMISGIQENYAHRLQKILLTIDATGIIELRPSKQGELIKLTERKMRLDKKEDALKALESDLERREHELRIRHQTMTNVLSAVEKGYSSPAKALIGLTPKKFTHTPRGHTSTEWLHTRGRELLFDDEYEEGCEEGYEQISPPTTPLRAKHIVNESVFENDQLTLDESVRTCTQ